MNIFYMTLLAVVGLINFMPIIGVVSAEKLKRAYAIELDDHNLIILMRHRALLFGVVGGYIIFSLLSPLHQNAAMIMGAVSMLGYLYFVRSAVAYNTALRKIAAIDIIGLMCLAGAAVLKFYIV